MASYQRTSPEGEHGRSPQCVAAMCVKNKVTQGYASKTVPGLAMPKTQARHFQLLIDAAWWLWWSFEARCVCTFGTKPYKQ